MIRLLLLDLDTAEQHESVHPSAQAARAALARLATGEGEVVTNHRLTGGQEVGVVLGAEGPVAAWSIFEEE